MLLTTVLPVFAIILAGYLAARQGLLGPASSEALNAFVYAVALPPLTTCSTSSRVTIEVSPRVDCARRWGSRAISASPFACSTA